MTPDALLVEATRRGERAFARAGIGDGASFDSAIAAVERTIARKIKLTRESDTDEWGPLTGYVVSLNCDHVYVRARDPEIYQEYTAFHELGHLLDEQSTCCNSTRTRLASANWALIAQMGTANEQILGELVAEYVAQRFASAVHAAPPLAEVAW